jgi:hypothetical protein
MFRHGWVRTTGRVLDSRIRKLYYPGGEKGTAAAIPLHSYIVEFQAPGGETTRLEVEQHIETVDVAVGSHVPLLVKPDATKAVFDDKDPSINVMAVAKAGRDADTERFRQELDGAAVDGGAPQSHGAQLTELKRLLDDGAVTPEEYFARLQRIVDSP